MQVRSKALLWLSILCCSNVTIAAPNETKPDEKVALRTAIGQINQAKGRSAIQILQKLDDKNLTEKDSKFRKCALNRLLTKPKRLTLTSPKTGQADRFTSDLLFHYRTYWQAAALKPELRTDAEKALMFAIKKLLNQPKLPDWDAIYAALDVKTANSDFKFLKGTTGVLQELMIWGFQKETVETVNLPEGSNPTTIYYLDGFKEMGWSSYLSCERTGTGGWTNDEGIYVVVPSYDSLTDENFKINLLAHESQHFSDKKQYKVILGWRLEYRAKLVELAYAVNTRASIIDNFSSNQGDDLKEDHSYANKKVLEVLQTKLGLGSIEELKAASVQRLQAAAVEELKADSIKLKAEQP
jgi:hypothetical protein